MGWRVATGSDVGTRTMVGHGGSGTQVKVVTGSSCADDPALGVVDGLPCSGDACFTPALAVAVGSYSLCICEAAALNGTANCVGWYLLGPLEIFGPLRWELPL